MRKFGAVIVSLFLLYVLSYVGVRSLDGAITGMRFHRGPHVENLVVPPPQPAPPAIWPLPNAPLTAVPAPTPSRSLRVVIDAGHGAPENPGNTSVFCEPEQEFTLRTQDEIVRRLQSRSFLEVRAGRPSKALLPYPDRKDAAERWPADAFISLHSDARAGDGWAVHPETRCYVGLGAPGFSVLYSDEGDPVLVERRRRLAQRIAVRMEEAGFPAYSGIDYGGLYDADAQAGVFVDRHAPKKRIMMLRRPKIPSVIVETHQAVDPEEAARWNEPRTLDAFAAALAAALVDVAES